MNHWITLYERLVYYQEEMIRQFDRMPWGPYTTKDGARCRQEDKDELERLQAKLEQYRCEEISHSPNGKRLSSATP